MAALGNYIALSITTVWTQNKKGESGNKGCLFAACIAAQTPKGISDSGEANEDEGRKRRRVSRRKRGVEVKRYRVIRGSVGAHNFIWHKYSNTTVITSFVWGWTTKCLQHKVTENSSMKTQTFTTFTEAAL